MSRSGRPDNRDTFSLLVRNVAFRTRTETLSRLFGRYGEVVDVYIPRDSSTGNPRGFAFVRYKCEYEAQNAVDRLDGREVDGRQIIVQFASSKPYAEKIDKGSITEEIPMPGGLVRRHSPRGRYQDDYRDRDYRRRSWSRSRERSEQDRHQDDYRDRDYRRRSRNRSRERSEQDRYRDSDHCRHSRTCSFSPDYDRKRSRYSGPPSRRSPNHSRSPSPHRAPSGEGTPSKPRDERPSCSGGP